MTRLPRQWVRVSSSENILAADTEGYSDLLSSAASELDVTEWRAKTIATVIGNFGFVSNISPVVGLQRIRAGIVTLPRGISAGEVPIVGTDSYPWMWYLDYFWTNCPREGAATPTYFNISVNIPVHIRSMRKLHVSETLALKVISDGGVRYGFGGNCLLLG